MRISGKHLVSLLVTSLALAGCGSEEGTDSGATNAPPIISGTPATTLAAGTAYSFTPSAADPDNDTLVFRATNVPVWASFNAATGALTGTPTEAHVGMTQMIQIEVTDNVAVAQLPPFQINVTSNSTTPPPTNVAPTITGTPATTAFVGQNYIFAPVAALKEAQTGTLVARKTRVSLSGSAADGVNE
jgi:large repetitive protein